jgi:ABC-type uncharacterized transport system substrate-binding protein
MVRSLRSWLLAFLFLAVPLLEPVKASAHPHIWIDAVADFVIADGKLSSLKIQWTFDEMFSGALRDQFDPEKTGHFSGKALADLRADANKGLKDFNWFTHLKIGGKKLIIAEGKDFTATIEGERVVYRFTVPIEPPVDPAKVPVTLSLYDQSFYIDVELAESNPVRIEGTNACKTKVVIDKGNPLYYGMFFPQRIDLTCQ